MKTIVKKESGNMAGLLKKIRTAFLASAHRLVDLVIDLDSVEAVKQHVRDLEGAIGDLEDSAAISGGHRRTVGRDVETLGVRVEELDGNIDTLLRDSDDSNDHLALPLQARFDAMTAELETKRKELAVAEQTYGVISGAVSKLRAKHQQMVGQIRRLRAMESAAKAKEQAAEAMREAGEVAGGVAAISVDDVAKRIQARADVAEERLQRAMGDFTSTVDEDVALATASANMAERKARIAAQRKEAAEEAVAATAGAATTLRS